MAKDILPIVKQKLDEMAEDISAWLLMMQGSLDTDSDYYRAAYLHNAKVCHMMGWKWRKRRKQEYPDLGPERPGFYRRLRSF